MNKLLIPTGYMGSGSSAMTDILQELQDVEAPNGRGEYVFLHCPNGVFDLEDKLLVGNNAIRSDEAIRSFRQMMKELYSNMIWWVGRYKRNLSKDFMLYVDEFIDELIDSYPSYRWYYQEDRRLRALPRIALHIFGRKLFKSATLFSVPKLYDQMVISIPEPEEFYRSAKVFLSKVFNDLGLNEHSIVMDQLILPFNAWRFDSYFDDNTECLIVDRDPRDVFIFNKYIWGPKLGVPVPYSNDVSEFCEHYRRLRKSERPATSPHVHRFHFEDLIYRYEESLERISAIAGLEFGAKGALFDPAVSINNTQLFLDSKYQEEAEMIEQRLPEYVYDFPYERYASLEESF